MKKGASIIIVILIALLSVSVIGYLLLREREINTKLSGRKCVELIEGHNNINENRINIVFVSINRDIKTLINHSIASIDYYADNEEGLMAIEPFKSNKDKFNFFYVDEVGYVNVSTATSQYGYEANPEIARLESYCNLSKLSPTSFGGSKLYTIAFTDFKIVNNADYGGNIRIAYFETPRPKIVVHEFGHSFGLLFDERGESSVGDGEGGYQNRNCYFPRYINCTTFLKCFPGGKCGNVTICSSTPESIIDCELNADWKDLIGNGCGEDGVIDCSVSYINLTEEVCEIDEGIYTCRNVTNKILEIPEANVEISCNLGCDYYIDAYRSTFSNIMVSSGNYFSFGSYNERLLCKRIKELTGSVGGICL